MSEGTSLLDNHQHRHSADRKMTFFQAQTTHFQINPALAMRCHESSPDAIPVILRGSKTCKTTIGRGHDATIQIGKANKRVSREHVVIEHKPQMGGFELTILSPNGALIDHIVFVEGEHVPVIEGTTIEIVGTKIIFQVPDDNNNNQVAETEDMEDIIETPLDASFATTVVDAKMGVDEKTIQQDNIPVMAMKQSTIASTTTTTAITTTHNNTTTTTTVTQKSSTHHHTKSTLNSIIKSTASKLKETARNIMKKPMTLEDEIIQVLDITKRLQEQTVESVLDALKKSTAIGCVKRLGKTADGSPKEDLYYYKPELDPDQERQKRYSDMGRSARKCTMKDTQYFFRIPPKLPHHKTAKTRKRESASSNSRKSRQAATEEDDTKSTSSGDVSDMEVYELYTIMHVTSPTWLVYSIHGTLQRRPSWKALRIKDSSKTTTEYACNNVVCTFWLDENPIIESNAKCQNNISDQHQNDDNLEEEEEEEMKANHKLCFVIQQEESEFNNVFSFVTHEEVNHRTVRDSHHHGHSSIISDFSSSGSEDAQPILKVPLDQELQDLFDVDKELWRQSQLFNHIPIKQSECSG
ncbi:hypothetical protein MAM1_0199c07835 [Mucor ambiguus]|uniref:FHA domain-containing protein n=1 Tax=Mucor ambiguus TaxID=91626 RepID=A0A0C9MCI6_9FUNG|nr:hypothetical protein MAM1_0199c07835 [Mucor ambiguus]